MVKRIGRREMPRSSSLAGAGIRAANRSWIVPLQRLVSRGTGGISLADSVTHRW